jgi:hypothetical protein
MAVNLGADYPALMAVNAGAEYPEPIPSSDDASADEGHGGAGRAGRERSPRRPDNWMCPRCKSLQPRRAQQRHSEECCVAVEVEGPVQNILPLMVTKAPHSKKISYMVGGMGRLERDCLRQLSDMDFPCVGCRPSEMGQVLESASTKTMWSSSAVLP